MRAMLMMCITAASLYASVTVSGNTVSNAMRYG